MIRKTICLSLLFASLACVETPDTAQQQVAAARRSNMQHTFAACVGTTGELNPLDSILTYTDIRESEDDLAGLLFKLDVAGDSVQGQYAEAAGEIGAWRQMSDITMSAYSDSIRFTLPNGPESSRFEGRINCDSLWGMFWAFPSSQGGATTFYRVAGDSLLPAE